MSAPSAKISVLATKKFVCIRIAGRANFTFGHDFKTLSTELRQKDYRHFIIDLSDCVLMDSTFLGVLAGFGLKLNPNGAPAADENGIELLNPNARISELLENLGVLHLFKITIIAPDLSEAVTTCAPAPTNPTHEQIARVCLEAHQMLMAVNPDNVDRFKDVAQFLAEDLKNLEKPA